MPPSVAREIEFLRRQLGLSQTQLASLIGRSQGQLANALRGHDPISGAAVNRLREVLLQKERCAKISILSIA
jgi:transcriptional regulator with XRE-family HTH domain